MHKPSSLKVEGEIGIKDKKTMTSLREGIVAFKKRKQNKQKKKKDDKNISASISNSDEVLVLLNECLHVDEQRVEWIINTITSCHATSHLELFSDYRVGDFGTIKMGNFSHSKIVGMSDVCFETNMGCYKNHFGRSKWKLTKGSLVVAKGEACCTLYKTQRKVCNNELHDTEGTFMEFRSKKKLEKLELVYFDVCGPMDVETLRGNKMNHTIIERVRCMLKTEKLLKVFWGPLNFEVPEKA
ncbi:hypothetical protein AAG906_026766 [Vitis piasezkii]